MASPRDSRAAGRKGGAAMMIGSVAVPFLGAVNIPYLILIPPIVLAVVLVLGLLMIQSNREADG